MYFNLRKDSSCDSLAVVNIGLDGNTCEVVQKVYKNPMIGESLCKKITDILEKEKGIRVHSIGFVETVELAYRIKLLVLEVNERKEREYVLYTMSKVSVYI